MAILLGNDTRVIVQGITGREGSFHARQMIEYGTTVVGGVTPGKGGTSFEGVPVFDTVQDAIGATQANATVIFVPGPFAGDAILEAEAAQIPFVCAITEGIPQHDMLRVVNSEGERHFAFTRPQLSWRNYSWRVQNRNHAGTDFCEG